MLTADMGVNRMDEQGLWDLFWATGLPEAWLGARLQTEEKWDSASCVAPLENTDHL